MMGRVPPSGSKIPEEPSSSESAPAVREPPTRAGVPAPPGAFDGRAHAFRESQTRKRAAQRERIGVIVVVALIVLGFYTLATARPYTTSPGSNFPTPGPQINVYFGTPSTTTLTCAGGGTAYAERVPWANTSEPVTTGDINLRLYEIWDRDFISDPNVVANATPTNLCAGATPSPIALWYAVLASPNGTNLLTFTVANDWTALGHGAWNFVIENGSALFVIASSPLAGTGRGFAVYGYSGGSPIFGNIPL